MNGSPLPGVAVGSTITGQIQVDLTRLPADIDPLPTYTAYRYGGAAIPGFTIEFSTGQQTITYDSLYAVTQPPFNFRHLPSEKCGARRCPLLT